jgi:hypothetical protein
MRMGVYFFLAIEEGLLGDNDDDEYSTSGLQCDARIFEKTSVGLAVG